VPYKNLAAQREHQRLWAQKHRKETRHKAQGKRRDLVREHKNVPCADCGGTFPYYVMDLDHREGETKVASVSQMVISHGIAKIREELEKCDVVCANCHRERTQVRNPHT